MVRLGVVSFLNALPLIDGLDKLAGVELRCDVPSMLLYRQVAGDVDVGLCSSIDYQRCDEPLVALSAGLLGCDGPTLTVRLFAASPIERLDTVHCDSDSHTSVVLLRILLKELYGIQPEIIAYSARAGRDGEWPDVMLLIGDKVVTASPPAAAFPHQLDLGAAWVEHTGLPFVFALWMASRGADPSILATAAAILDRQRRHNVERLDGIVHREAGPRGWPAGLAREYLKSRLAFDFTEDRRAGLELFFDKAAAHGFVERRRPLELV